MPDRKPVIFTDLDGTLLDAGTYSFEPAMDALRLVKGLGVPLIICTSKTRAEVLRWRARLGNDHPFIVENGGGVYLPHGYFGPDTPGLPDKDGYLAAEFGTPYRELRDALALLKSEGFDVSGFGDMTAEEVAELTGLSVDEACMAKEREFDEPFVYHGGKGPVPRLVEAIRNKGLNYTAGRVMHILGDNDKGRAVKYIAGLYGRESGGIVTAAMGDSLNDAPMLQAVDYPFLVRKPDGLHEPLITDTRVIRVGGIGPEGWSEAVMRLMKMLGIV